MLVCWKHGEIWFCFCKCKTRWEGSDYFSRELHVPAKLNINSRWNKKLLPKIIQMNSDWKHTLRLNLGCHVDVIRQLAGGGKWRLRCQTQRWRRTECCSYSRWPTEGASELRCAFIWFQTPGYEARNKAISWCLVFLWQRHKVAVWARLTVCVSVCLR